MFVFFDEEWDGGSGGFPIKWSIGGYHIFHGDLLFMMFIAKKVFRMNFIHEL
jgi:hypothetical protein